MPGNEATKLANACIAAVVNLMLSSIIYKQKLYTGVCMTIL
jgi:hypothetical protein